MHDKPGSVFRDNKAGKVIVNQMMLVCVAHSGLPHNVLCLHYTVIKGIMVTPLKEF